MQIFFPNGNLKMLRNLRALKAAQCWATELSCWDILGWSVMVLHVQIDISCSNWMLLATKSWPTKRHKGRPWCCLVKCLVRIHSQVQGTMRRSWANSSAGRMCLLDAFTAGSWPWTEPKKTSTISFLYIAMYMFFMASSMVVRDLGNCLMVPLLGLLKFWSSGISPKNLEQHNTFWSSLIPVSRGRWWMKLLSWAEKTLPCKHPVLEAVILTMWWEKPSLSICFGTCRGAVLQTNEAVTCYFILRGRCFGLAHAIIAQIQATSGAGCLSMKMEWTQARPTVFHWHLIHLTRPAKGQGQKNYLAKGHLLQNLRMQLPQSLNIFT